MKTRKTDNSNLVSKLVIRRYFLDRYHKRKSFSIFDACQGEKVLWGILEKEYRCDYWGVDKKPKPGRLRIDSERILEQPGWSFDVIDIDTYGSPWRHWLNLLPNVTRPVTVFLTIELIRVGGGGQMSKQVLKYAAPRFETGLIIPRGILGSLAEYFANAMLARAYKWNLEIVEAGESARSANARYVGIRICPKKE